jgi:hypothetical protein
LQNPAFRGAGDRLEWIHRASGATQRKSLPLGTGNRNRDQNADVKERLSADGSTPMANSPEEFSSFIKTENREMGPGDQSFGAPCRLIYRSTIRGCAMNNIRLLVSA